MDLKVYDHDYFDSDVVAQRVYEGIKEKLSKIDGIWLYREPEMRTESNEYPTFTILSREYGLYFIKVYDFSSSSISCVENKFWVIDGKKVKSPCIFFRNYVHKIISKIDDPLNEFDGTDHNAKTIYIFPFISNNELFCKLNLTENEKYECGKNDFQMDET